MQVFTEVNDRVVATSASICKNIDFILMARSGSCLDQVDIISFVVALIFDIICGN